MKNLSLIEDRTLANFQNWLFRPMANLQISNAGHATVVQISDAGHATATTAGGVGRTTVATPWSGNNGNRDGTAAPMWMVVMDVACGGSGGGLDSFEGLL